MSIKLLDNEAFYGFRVRRTVNGKLYQEYFSLKKNGRRMGPRLQKQVERQAAERVGDIRARMKGLTYGVIPVAA